MKSYLKKRTIAPTDGRPTIYDAGYYGRYEARNLQKLQAILDGVQPVQSILDIGCNTGYICEALLASGKAKRATGVELDRAAVWPKLLERNNFTLFEGSIIDFPFAEVYDAVFYLSIHHHVFGGHGRERAFQLWRDILNHCNRYLFYEPALVTEKGEFYWKDAIRRQFDDNDHWRLLLGAVGSRLRRVDCITRLDIHGASRPLYRIELHPLGSEYDLLARPETFYGAKFGADAAWNVIRRLRRSRGRTGQSLIPADNTGWRKDIFPGTDFFVLQNRETGELGFGKRTHEDPYRQMREFLILEQVQHPRIPPVLSVTPTYGLIFPYYGWQTLESLQLKRIVNADEFWKQLSSTLDEVLNFRVNTGLLDLDCGAYHTVRRLGEMIDMHASNVLVKMVDGAVTDWRLVDFEYFSNANTGRNAGHLADIRRMINEPRRFRGILRRCIGLMSPLVRIIFNREEKTKGA